MYISSILLQDKCKILNCTEIIIMFANIKMSKLSLIYDRIVFNFDFSSQIN